MRHDFLWMDLAALKILERVGASIDMCLGAATNRRNFFRRILEGMLCSSGVIVVGGSLSLSLPLSFNLTEYRHDDSQETPGNACDRCPERASPAHSTNRRSRRGRSPAACEDDPRSRQGHPDGVALQLQAHVI